MSENNFHCPLTGKPCQHLKAYNITEINKTGTHDLKLCQHCVEDYLNNHPPGETPKLANPEEPSEKIVNEVAPPEEIKELVQTLFAGIFPGHKIEVEMPVKASQPTPISKPPCPSCGMTIPEFLQVKRLGCPKCWEHFETELTRLLGQVHGAVSHVGKVPSQYKELAADQNKINKLDDLKQKMRIAVKSEDYETAAILRDTIQRIEDELG